MRPVEVFVIRLLVASYVACWMAGLGIMKEIERGIADERMRGIGKA